LAELRENPTFQPKRRGQIKLAAVFGTRPEAIKMAPVIKALTDNPDVVVKTIVTAQHREMLDQVLELFSIRPDYDLDLMSPQQGLTAITTKALQGLEPIFRDESPDLVLVHGDTTTTFAGSLAAFYRGIPVGHVEAGLRTGDKLQPYPEEMNRLLTTRLADLHFAPTAQAGKNLLREHIPAESIFVTGNTVIDALHQVQENLTADEKKTAIPRLVLVTAHRRESWGRPLGQIITALKRIIVENTDIQLLIPVHLNPAVRQVFQTELGDHPRVTLTDPLDYREMVKVLASCHLVLTDSGGIQEEAPALGKPVLVLREKTERPEAIAAGTVKLVGTDPARIVSETNRLLQDDKAYQSMAQAVNPYGDGRAAERIAGCIRVSFGLDSRLPEEFVAPGNGR
jgi:UDP-N-acetylglucosamine 2-epimerase (non-hydrolysing)